jgi:DNA polymerase III sliding clamp (beta) subunit (PCNA family)
MEKLKNFLSLYDKRSTLMVQANGHRYALMGERELDKDRLLYARWKAGEAQGPVVAVDTSLFKEAIKRNAQVSLNGKVWVGEVGLECREVEFAMPTIEPQVWVSRKELLGSLEAGLEATSTDPTRGVFKGAQFEFSPKALKLVACDGFVLAERTIPVRGALEGKVVVHRDGLTLMIKALKGVEEFEVALSLKERELGLKAGVLEMSLTLMEGQYPDYQRVITKPEQWQISVEVYVPALVEALEALRPLFARLANQRVDVRVEPGAMRLEVNGDCAQASRSVPCVAQGAMGFSVNGQYFLERLQPVRGSGKLHIVDSEKPLLIEGGLYRGIVVPLRV